MRSPIGCLLSRLELISAKVDVLVIDGVAAGLAAKEATATIPIVMAVAGDPVRTGLITSLAKPGGNITGLTLMTPELSAKRLEVLREVVPKASRVAVLLNPSNRPTPSIGKRPKRRVAAAHYPPGHGSPVSGGSRDGPLRGVRVAGRRPLRLRGPGAPARSPDGTRRVR